MVNGEFEVAVERKQNHENDEQSERADQLHLVFGFEEFAVFAAPAEPIAGRQGLFDVRNGALSVGHGALQIAAFDAVLHADIARVVFAIDKRCAAGLVNIRELAQRNLLAGWCADEQVADLLRVLAELRLHAHDEIE